MLLNDAIKSAPEIVEIPRVVLVYTWAREIPDVCSTTIFDYNLQSLEIICLRADEGFR